MNNSETDNIMLEDSKKALELGGKSSSKANSFFSSTSTNISMNNLSTILQLVSQGEQDKAKLLIRQNPEVLAMRSKITDWTGRTFTISPWEYALWAMDTRYMCRMMIECIPHDGRGDIIRDQLLAQYYSLKTDGICYELEGKTITESHFNFELLINALDDYVNSYEKWSNKEREQHWISVIGMEQRKLVVHVRQHYCDLQNNFEKGHFRLSKFNRSLRTAEVAGVEKANDFWDLNIVNATSSLGVDFALSQERWGLFNHRALCPRRSAYKNQAMSDKFALCDLRDQRIKDFAYLESTLYHHNKIQCAIV
jgi:hypothetical protein